MKALQKKASTQQKLKHCCRYWNISYNELFRGPAAKSRCQDSRCQDTTKPTLDVLDQNPWLKIAVAGPMAAAVAPRSGLTLSTSPRANRSPSPPGQLYFISRSTRNLPNYTVSARYHLDSFVNTPCLTCFVQRQVQ